MNKKGQCKKLIAEVRSILINDWDPIGVGTNPNLADEYDVYIGRIIKMFSTGCSLVEVASFLQTVEEKEIGCKRNSTTRYIVATKLQKCFKKRGHN